VVGVVRDVRETVRSPAGMRIYYPNWIKPTYINSLVLRLDQDPGKEFSVVVRRGNLRVRSQADRQQCKFNQ